MPGIYTHNYIFRKCVENIQKNRNRSYITRSIEALFSTPDHFRAGMFGAIGPNIFDYMQYFRNGGSYCSEISFALHDRNCSSFLRHLMEIVTGYRDSRNEWSSVQRGYLYGYISHIISDAILHPYIFYSSGFPDRMERNEINFYRKKNLRFQYNIDNYFLYRDESGMLINSLEDMFPVYKVKRKTCIWPSLKYLILESLRRENESLLRKYFKDIKAVRIDGDLGPVRNFDRIPANISLCYRMKRTENPKLINLIDRLCDNPYVNSDFLIRYPGPKRVDVDAMNIHLARWQYPGLQRGFRYESVLQLIKSAIEQTVLVWEIIEPVVYGSKIAEFREMNYISAYTGEKGVFFSDMKIKDPVKLKV
jgi:hypothetical protein